MLDTPAIPDGWRHIKTIESHTAGEPLRIVYDGIAPIDGETILERRRTMQSEYDHLRTALMAEPRGHYDMYGAILTEPVSPEADVGVLFTTNKGYSSMCGHGIIALGTALPEAGMLPASPPDETIVFDTPAGLVTATSEIEGDAVTSVSFENVPSFAPLLDQTVEVPEFGDVEFDLGYGGAFYAYVPAGQLDLELTPENADEIRRAGMAIKRAVAEGFDIEHPTEDDLSFLYGTILTEPSPSADSDVKNVCVFADGQIDRSPTGTGVSGHLAIRHAKGDIDDGDELVVDSIIDSRFRGTISGHTTMGDYEAVRPAITGSAHITGTSDFVVDPDDEFGDGFYVR